MGVWGLGFRVWGVLLRVVVCDKKLCRNDEVPDMSEQHSWEPAQDPTAWTVLLAGSCQGRASEESDVTEGPFWVAQGRSSERHGGVVSEARMFFPLTALGITHLGHTLGNELVKGRAATLNRHICAVP